LLSRASWEQHAYQSGDRTLAVGHRVLALDDLLAQYLARRLSDQRVAATASVSGRARRWVTALGLGWAQAGQMWLGVDAQP
jgi:hypothetical protein